MTDTDDEKLTGVFQPFQNEFSDAHNYTVFDTYTKTLTLEDQPVHMTFWDTPGREDYAQQCSLYYSETDVFLICFSIANPDSLKNVQQKWFPEINRHCPDVPKILVGTKLDLRRNKDIRKRLTEKNKKPVKKRQARAVAMEIGAAKYMECSALTNSRLEGVFINAIRAVLVPNSLKEEQPKNGCIVM